MGSNNYNIPVVLCFFKRVDKLILIIERIKQIKPEKIYLLSDGGRNETEHHIIKENRKIIEGSIDWNCRVIKKYANENIGVYKNIGEGAKWIFEREDSAIFLEDDNLPELSFFDFCKELLYKYRKDTRILWICGTNYLKNYTPEDGSSYLFTRNMMPCGWASWADKFNRFYDGNFNSLSDSYIAKNIESDYLYKPLFRQDFQNWNDEIRRLELKGKPASWDYQMSLSLRIHKLYGIVPKYNQIMNIGVDKDSIHGGTNLQQVMTKRFCELPTKTLEFPLVHPKTLLVDEKFEKEIAKIITYPLFLRLKSVISRKIKYFLKIETEESLKQYLIQLLSKK